MTDDTVHKGGCHCGKVRFTVTTDLAQVMSCNCSICEKRGTLFNFVPAAQFSLSTGADALIDYQFNKKTIHHVFCGTCGVSSFARGTAPDGAEMVAVNVRCLDDIDIGGLTVTPIDGRSF